MEKLLVNISYEGDYLLSFAVEKVGLRSCFIHQMYIFLFLLHFFSFQTLCHIKHEQFHKVTCPPFRCCVTGENGFTYPLATGLEKKNFKELFRKIQIFIFRHDLQRWWLLWLSEVSHCSASYWQEETWIYPATGMFWGGSLPLGIFVT